MPAVTVVVPTCGRPELLARCLAAVERQSLPREEYDIGRQPAAQRAGGGA